MQTADIVRKNFKQDLKALLKKYDAEIDVDVEMSEWGAMVEGIRIDIPNSYDIDGELIREETSFRLTKWFNWETL